jgi:hypothetical protein
VAASPGYALSVVLLAIWHHSKWGAEAATQYMILTQLDRPVSAGSNKRPAIWAPRRSELCAPAMVRRGGSVWVRTHNAAFMRCFCYLGLSIARLSVIEEYLRIGPDADENVAARGVSNILNKAGMVLYRTLVLERDTWNQ